MKALSNLLALLSLAAGLIGTTSAQTIPLAERRQLLEKAQQLLREQYFQPEVATKLAQRLRENRRAYEAIADGPTLTKRITTDLYAVAHDKHLRVFYYPNGVTDDQVWNRYPTAEQKASQLADMRAGMPRENFGILDLSVLKYNIGYLNLQYLADPEVAGESYVAALNYLAHTDALVLDLRQCRGAMSQYAIPLLCSYFFAEPTHLNSWHWRENNRLQQSWTTTQVPGRRYLGKPIYVLIGPATFSGAEELAYDLQAQKRATLVGQPTGGGANPGGSFRISEHMTLFIPAGQVVNPITHTNWEGVGVQPDTVVSAARTLHVAQVLALRQVAATPTTAPDWRGVLQGQLQEWAQHPPQLHKLRFTLAGEPNATQVSVAGSFNNWSVAATPLIRQGNAWIGEIEAAPGPLSYKFVVDGRWLSDPANPRTDGPGSEANSVVEVKAN
jgi:hypothetical protein